MGLPGGGDEPHLSEDAVNINQEGRQKGDKRLLLLTSECQDPAVPEANINHTFYVSKLVSVGHM